MPPLAAGAHEIEQPVQQASQISRAQAASGLGGSDQRLQQSVLVIAQGLARAVVSNQVFSPGIWWSGSTVDRFGSAIQVLQMASYGVRPLRVFNRRPKL